MTVEQKKRREFEDPKKVTWYKTMAAEEVSLESLLSKASFLCGVVMI